MHKNANDHEKLVLLSALTLATVIILRNAWMADDAYISLRTVDHFCSGRGLTWNPGERVQAYTHPLWLFLISAFYWLTDEAYFLTITLGLIVSLGALAGVALLHARTIGIGAALIFVLISTRSFVDYSTSGLENPLTHLLLALHLWVYCGKESPRRIFQLGLVASLLALNRMDAILLVLPTTLQGLIPAFTAAPKKLRLVGSLVLAVSPFLLWEAFSLFYYGSLVPNTALAKLNTGVSQGDLSSQGLLYFVDTLERDSLTLIVIALGIGSVTIRGGTKYWTVSAGVVAYLIYIVSIGGDFMSGRFLTAPLFSSALLLARLLPSCSINAAAIACAGLLLGLISLRPTFLFVPLTADAKEIARSGRGITDEQAFWYSESGLLTASRGRPMPASKHRTNGEAGKPGVAEEVGAAGFRGFFSPPNVFLLDHNALVDPLLSRLPAIPGRWRPGHFRRRIPRGYPETLVGPQIRIKDPAVAQLYRDVRLVTRGDLFAQGRLSAIVRLTTGRSARSVGSRYK